MKKVSLLVMISCIFLFVACDSDDNEASGGRVQTTLTKTYVPVTKETGKGFDLVIGRGEPHRLRKLYDSAPEPSGSFWSLAYFLVMTDQHVTDEQHPARSAFFDTTTVFFGMFEAGFRPQEDLSPHLVNASVMTANQLNCDYFRNLDMVLALGDFADNAALSEFTWALDIMNDNPSSIVAPWSGSLERDLGSQQAYDPYRRPDYYNSNAAFPIVGLKRCDLRPTPWYAAIGNHDVLNIGNFPVDMPEWPLNNFLFTGEDYTGGLSAFGYLRGLPTLVTDTLDQENTPAQAFYNRLTFYGDPVLGTLMGILLSTQSFMDVLVKEASEGPTVIQNDINANFSFAQLNAMAPGVTKNEIGVHVLPDSNRQHVHPKSLFQMLRDGGHGFWLNSDQCSSVFPGGVDPDEGYYTLDYTTEAGVGVPIRIIFLNTDEEPLRSLGGMSSTQWDWLECQLDRGLQDQKLVIIASHMHAKDIYQIDGVCRPGNCTEVFIELLQSYPNVIAHVAGHTHINDINPQADDKEPENGYWEVITDSTEVWPQQTRILEVVVYENGVGEIWSTMLDHDDTLSQVDAVDQLTALARKLSVNDYQLTLDGSGLPMNAGTLWDRNVVLRFQVPSEIVSSLQATLTPSSRIQSRDVFPKGALSP